MRRVAFIPSSICEFVYRRVYVLRDLPYDTSSEYISIPAHSYHRRFLSPLRLQGQAEDIRGPLL
jgi:hypothetical protein